MKAEYSPVINWLLTAQEPWVVYNTLLDLIGAEPDSTEVKAAYKAMQTHPSVIVHPTLRHNEVAQQAADYLFHCWEHRADPLRPVGFGIGSTWDKVQYPFVQY